MFSVVWTLLLCLGPGQTPAELPPLTDDKKAAIAASSLQDLSSWLMTYYQAPDPETLPARVRRMSELKMLEKRPHPQAFEMFFGQILRKHPDQIDSWMQQLADLPEAEAKILHQAIWISQTEQGKQWLSKHGQQELATKEGHPLTTNSPYVMEPYHNDMLWEWFFATGDALPVQKLVGNFGMLPADPGEDRLPPRPKAGLDRPTYLRMAIGGSAVWSSSSLASSHNRLLEILKETQKDQRLSPRCAAWLKRVIEIAEEARAKAPAT
jgi:hypothetical protein